MEVVSEAPKTPQIPVKHKVTGSTVSRHSFYIQDILSPGFGNKQLKNQYYAYLNYCYSLHLHNVTFWQRLQTEKQDFESLGLSLDHHTDYMQKISRNKASDDTQSSKFVQSSEISDAIDNNCNAKIFLAQELVSPGIFSQKTCKSKTVTHVNTINKKQCKKDLDGHCNSITADKVAATPKKEHDSDIRNDGEGESSLWPAWVYCTRYSDRPSSGNSLHVSYFFISHHQQNIVRLIK